MAVTNYFSTLLGISMQAAAIVIAFYAAYQVYLRQQRDKYRERVVKSLQELDRLVTRWSLLEEYTADWHQPIGKYFQILEKETWKKSVEDESLKELLINLDKVFARAQQKEMEHRRKFDGHLAAGGALYLEVELALNSLISAIYREFPQPPGDYKISEHGEIPYDVKSMIRCDFPTNKQDFLSWVDRFSLFFKGIHHVYYRIKPILSTLRKINEDSVDQTVKLIRRLEERDEGSWVIDGAKDWARITTSRINYYEQVFVLLGDMRYKSDKIKERIGTYDNYFYKGKWKTITSLLAMVATGLIIPFAGLFTNIYLLPFEYVEAITAFGFGLSTLLAIYLIYRDISKF